MAIAKAKVPKVVAPKVGKISFPKQPGIRGTKTNKGLSLKPMKVSYPKTQALMNPKSANRISNNPGVIHTSVGGNYTGSLKAM